MPTMPIDWLQVSLRWLHIVSAIALVGGLLYERIALLGPAAGLPDAARAEFLAAARRRWSKVVMLTALVLLVTGAVNATNTMMTFRVAFEKDQPDLNLPRTLYFSLLGGKLLLALVIFFFASVLSGNRAGTAGFRAKAAKWLNVTIVLALLVVGMGDVMRSFHTGPNVKLVEKALSKETEAPPFQGGGK